MEKQTCFVIIKRLANKTHPSGWDEEPYWVFTDKVAAQFAAWLLSESKSEGESFRLAEAQLIAD